MFVVAGITGNTGKVVAERLKGEGKQVRAFVRNASHRPALEAQGFEVLVGELFDQAALSRALEGAEGAYLLVPPFYGPGILSHQAKVARTIAKALKESDVKRTVLLSSIGAELPEGSGPIITCHVLEEACAGIDSVTFLRASYFMENWLSVLGAAQKDGVLPSFMPKDVAFPMVATRDIGLTAADLLLQRDPPKRVVQLAGPKNLRPADVTAAFSAILNKSIQQLDLPLEALVGGFVEAGVPEELAKIFLEMYQAIHDGRLHFDDGEVRRGSTSMDSVLQTALGVEAAAE